jgi:hypothetical protein
MTLFLDKQNSKTLKLLMGAEGAKTYTDTGDWENSLRLWSGIEKKRYFKIEK